MAGILIIAHAPLASALRECISHIYGSCPARISVVDVSPNQDTVKLLETIRQYFKYLHEKNGVLVLTDLFGATPSNLAAELVGREIRVVGGVNLPMLIKAVCYRSAPLDILVNKVISGGTQGILEIGTHTSMSKKIPNLHASKRNNNRE
ncbi:PTS sugar transporter subunit IIA [Candidatus Pandoraea novymonadis]|uniref:PTS system mannose-specific EIIAB component n=1 Tax=Candidatus Pandoraea novymonadis TaxID=1808959 RepID=A0ABX5FDC7_9BURK|nr:PTS sugar transporter subunit IIB [Candidatus Pandoraea novymonadis]PSB91740.1 PTS system mannose-specific EIIAB component [Candidatus Pandoraea novymonadis]